MSDQAEIAIVYASTIISLATLVWMSIKIHRGNGFFKEIETSSGTVKKRLDIDFVGSVILGALASGLNVLIIGNFLCLIITEEWAFDPKITKGSLILVLVVFSVYVANKVYDYTLDKAERKVRIREVEVEEKE